MIIRTPVRALAALAALSGAVARAPLSARLESQSSRATSQAPAPSAATPRAGQTATRLADGRWLLVGGEGAGTGASLWDPRIGAATATAGQPLFPRAWHTATLLADGSVLIIGGRNGDALADVPELFDPASGVFTAVSIVGAVARASHSATLLMDGRVLVAGGTNGGAAPLPTEIWDTAGHTATAMPRPGVDRIGHDATLTADGRLLLTGGTTIDGAATTEGVAIDTVAGTATPSDAPPSGHTVPVVSAALPEGGSTDVAVDAHAAVRFSTAMAPASLEGAFTLRGPVRSVAVKVVPAEQGRLAFVWPLEPLEEGTTYVLAIDGALDASGTPIVPSSVVFTTVDRSPAIDPADFEAWIPDAQSLLNGWRANRPPSPWESLPPLTAPPGVTAISGRALTLDGRPLRGVTLEMEGAKGFTDRTGRFLLVIPSVGPSVGRHVLEIDGSTASVPGRTYGFFEYGMNVAGGRTNVLDFTIWMPKLDTRHTVRIASPTTSEVVVTTPYIPGLELHIPPGTVIRGEDGQPVTELGITPVPIDRPPFPLPGIDIPVYFTIQPGGGYVHTAGTGPRGAWLVYPNYGARAIPGQVVRFFHYDPEVRGWYVYGVGKVTPNGTQVVPDPRTRLYEFTGAMINVPGYSPPPAGGTPGGTSRGDPMDPSTGVFVMHKTDLYLPDVIPLALTRTYDSGDNLARPFGRGMTHPYALTLWSALQYQEADLILPEGGRIHYVRTSPGTGFADAVFETTAAPTRFYASVIRWNGNGWDLTLADGTVYVFGDNAPLQAVRDRYGNTVVITHDGGPNGPISRVTSPNGRSITFAYDASNRVTQATDNLGRVVTYTYDANGNLSTVTDPAQQVATYTYDASNRLATITDGRGITYLTNTYDASGRVSQQTLADPTAAYQFAYTDDGSGSITQADITDPRGHAERLAFNSAHSVTSDTQALGALEARTITTEHQAGSNLVTAVVDGLNRRTEYTYGRSGHVLTATRLAGTAEAVTTRYTYEPAFSQLASVTDPLTHAWTLRYDAQARLTGVTDPLGHQTGLTLNGAGLVASVTDALAHTWQFEYQGGDLTSATDPLRAVRRRFLDGAGRVVSTTDPLGRMTWTEFDGLSRPTMVTDPVGGQTAFSYDANGNLLSLTDALSHVTSWTYDTFDRVATRTDPLLHAGSSQYDLNGNLAQATDRKGQATGFTYDALDRLSQVTFADASTISYTYDAGDRVTAIADSANGTIVRTYDGLDRLAAETTPQGTVAYTYDAAGRRTSMTVAGQPAVTYGYDDANRLTAITQGTAVVSLTYDDANRRNTLTYPNGIVATDGYDAANQLTSLTYTLGATTLGDLQYSYDAEGERTSVGGRWARTGIPPALTSATYDAANRILTWGGASFTYDANGNLASDGLTSYTWNARNQLAGLSGGGSASLLYDGLGRRRGKTISGNTTSFLYDEGDLVQELTSSGTTTANLLTGGVDHTFTRTDGGGTSILLTDALGSTVALADATGAVQTQYTFEPFGATTASGTTSMNAMQFTGRENDGTGLYAYRARFVSPALQRFVSEDPIGFAGGDVNLYAYVGNQPTMWRDPTGEVAFRPPPGCQWPTDKKDQPLSWPGLLFLLRCTPVVVPDLLPIPVPVPGTPRPPENFEPPTNPPQMPPTDIPSGWRVRPMPPTREYLDGYWRLEKPMPDGSWQPIDPSTMKPGTNPETHVPFPPGYVPK